MNIKELAKGVEQNVIKWRRHLHTIPEPGVDIPETADYVCKVLDELGIEYTRGVGLPDAIVGIIKGQQPGKTIALRADMDALPVVEETGLEFASTNGNMHACGHDAHTSVLLGAAQVLNENKEKFNGTIKLLFQPGEEISKGAEPMVKAGVLENVDYVLGMHLGNISGEAKAGDVLVNPGSMMACLDNFNAKIIGVGSHGAYPHDSIDPVVATGYILTALQEIISREINPVDPGVITVGKVEAGRTYNVIPGSAYIEGTARAVNQKSREYLATRIGEVIEGIASAFRCKAEYTYNFEAPPLVNDEDVAMSVYESAKKVMDPERIKIMKNPVMGGEDFACYLERVPGNFVFMANPLPIDGEIYPHHNSKFALDEKYFVDGVALFIQSTLDLLERK